MTVVRIGIILVGVSFVAMGLHAESAGYWSNRPLKLFFYFLTGATLVVGGIASVVRLWWRDR